MDNHLDWNFYSFFCDWSECERETGNGNHGLHMRSTPSLIFYHWCHYIVLTIFRSLFIIIFDLLSLIWKKFYCFWEVFCLYRDEAKFHFICHSRNKGQFHWLVFLFQRIEVFVFVDALFGIPLTAMVASHERDEMFQKVEFAIIIETGN